MTISRHYMITTISHEMPSDVFKPRWYASLMSLISNSPKEMNKKWIKITLYKMRGINHQNFGVSKSLDFFRRNIDLPKCSAKTFFVLKRLFLHSLIRKLADINCDFGIWCNKIEVCSASQFRSILLSFSFLNLII